MTKLENHFLTTKLTKYTKLLRILLVFKHHSLVHGECFVSNPFFVCFVYFVVSHSDSELDSPKIAEKTKEEVGLLGRFTEASAEIYGTTESAAHRELVIAHRIRSPTRCKKHWNT